MITLPRVMPSRQPACVGGVVSTPSRTMNTFSPDPSVMKPCSFSMMASSYPAFSDSTFASTQLMYWPVAFAAEGSEFWPFRRQLLILMRTPCSSASSPRYAPHGHTAMITFTGAFSGFTPISP